MDDTSHLTAPLERGNSPQVLAEYATKLTRGSGWVSISNRRAQGGLREREDWKGSNARWSPSEAIVESEDRNRPLDWTLREDICTGPRLMAQRTCKQRCLRAPSMQEIKLGKDIVLACG